MCFNVLQGFQVDTVDLDSTTVVACQHKVAVVRVVDVSHGLVVNLQATHMPSCPGFTSAFLLSMHSPVLDLDLPPGPQK
jgi:hypothetical protein